ncbi:hypothetical protein F383_22915 [Gossypium arboreum]|uniref:Uncharacterized protein n=1 Tax=Gossypium arboreum TaxID=29729 RepID=A0A0B0P2F5_GOSAR|nr:hypothetical protein F383_22915 [Gossypium arboreum]
MCTPCRQKRYEINVARLHVWFQVKDAM